MKTNTFRMTHEDRSRMMLADIAADTLARRERERTFRATVAMWRHADAAGLTAAERHALDMALAGGGDPTYLSTTF
jgi:hypothetical protein